jgi:hypothetical protein
MVLLASAYDQSRFFKAADLAAEKKLRIKTVTEEMIGMDKDKERKLVVWFTNDERGLVLNRINNRTIRGAYGDAVEGWVGKIIVVFPTMAEFRGKMGPALRVRPSGDGVAAKSAKKMPAPPADDPELEPEPVKSLGEELDDEIGF